MRLLPIKLGPLRINKVARFRTDPREHIGALAIVWRGPKKITYVQVGMDRTYRLDKLRDGETGMQRAYRLRAEHPDWSFRMILAAVQYGEESPAFQRAKARAW